QEKFKNTTNAYVEHIAKTSTNPIIASAAAAELAERGRTDKVNNEVLDKLMKAVQNTGTAKKFLEIIADAPMVNPPPSSREGGVGTSLSTVSFCGSNAVAIVADIPPPSV
ncbi:unnamed protein product, partial [marine sediment metagenome]